MTTDEPDLAWQVDLACSSTLPGNPSRRNMERHGFHVAYPRIVMLATR